MGDSLSQLLREQMECEGLLECIHGLKEIDTTVFKLLSTTPEPMTVDEVASCIDRERSTAYRSVQRLIEAGLVEKEQVNYEHGGYYHVYSAADPDAITKDLQRMLNDWYAKMGTLIGEFNRKYADESDTSTRTPQAET
ncbi:MULTISPECIES: helix-turn-helix domain-containing protein [unclassified Haladaptatus]|uniref:helix-turn-helix domain-containing protein n=1 Tax=unclassified Haladaptatus TaxID=2622732 RepID=UPI0023E8E559|nr:MULTISPECIES: helix-turn-helix domain-containing protein [unclassified Haladaptatus]